MSIRLALACAASIAALASTAQAETGRVATEVFVPSLGVDFADAAETAGFYASLERAALKACDSERGRDLGAAAADRRCATDALDQAVRQTGRASLTTLHAARTGREAPATLLAAH